MKNQKNLIIQMLLFLGCYNLTFAQFEPGSLYVRVTSESSIPTKTLELDANVFEFDNPTVDAIFQKHNLIDFKQAYPAAALFDHPKAEGLLRVYLATCDCDETILQTELISKASSSFDLIELVPTIVSLTTPNDYGSTGGFLEDDWALDIIGAEAAWDVTTGNPDIKISINEKEGFDTNHEDLAGQIVYEDGNVFEFLNHATAVAGCAAAATDNGLGKSAIGFNCKLMLYKSTSYNDILDASAKGASVVNCSWLHCFSSQTQQDCIDLVHDNRTVVTSGSGNGLSSSCSGGPSVGSGENGYGYPASYNHVISVSSITEFDKYEPADNPILAHSFNDSVDVTAPGHNMQLLIKGDAYADNTGTSFAAPTTAGLIGLLFSINPCLLPEEITSIIESTATDISANGNNSDYDGFSGAGRLCASAACLLAVTYVGPTVDHTSFTVTGSINWNNDIRMGGDITIKNGGVLTITSNVLMPNDGKIVVETGGQLILNGGSITCKCWASTWAGIEVQGASSLIQTAPNQGLARINNGGTIQNAKVGVKVNGGGILHATDANFVDNQISIFFDPYNNPNNKYVSNVGFIFTSTFTSTLSGQTFILLADVNRIRIQGNSFTGDQTLPDLERGIGITSYFSGFYVAPKCTTATSPCGGFMPNTFDLLNIGIVNLKLGMINRAIQIDGCEFDNVNIGVLSITSSFNQITNNSFIVPSRLNDWIHFPLGVFMYVSDGFLITENSFTGLATQQFNTFGAISRNSGFFGGQIYLNTFDNFDATATQAEQNNLGLEIECNTYTENLQDWTVIGSLKDQGFCAAGFYEPARNSFHINCAAYFHINSDTDFDYFTPATWAPTCINNVSVTHCGVDPNCASILGGGPGGHPDVASLKAAISQESDPYEKGLLISGLMQYYASTDSIQEAVDYMETLNIKSVHKLLVSTFLSTKDYTKCDQYLDSIPSVLTEDIEYHKLFDMLVEWGSTGNELIDLDSSRIVTVQEVANTATLVATKAEVILAYVLGIEYIRIPEFIPSSKNISSDEAIELIRNQDYFTIIPNPAGSDVNIQLAQAYSQDSYLRVYDFMGKKIREYPIRNSTSLQINTTDFDNGIYLVVLEVNKEIIDKKKLVILK